MGESLDTSAGQNLGAASPLIESLRSLIQAARQRALRAVDAVQVQTCWEIGRHIVEFEQAGAPRAEYGSRLLQTLATALSAELGRGFDASNLRYMRLFYQAFPIRDALRHELIWTITAFFCEWKLSRQGDGICRRLRAKAGRHGRSNGRSAPFSMTGC
jgi:hypothetical protein